MKICYLFTQSFPYGDSEIFIEKELPYLASYFSKVVIFPIDKLSEKQVVLPPNVSVVNLFEDESTNVSHLSKIRLNVLVGRFLLEEMRHQLLSMIFDFRWNFSLCKKSINRANRLKKYLDTQNLDNTIFYSYWFADWCLILALYKSIQNKTSFKFYARAHGFDVFKEQAHKGYHPFKNLIFKKIEKVYSVSKMGVNYLRINYPSFKKKISCSYLGCINNGLNPFKSDAVFHLVSCAHLRELKRLDLVPLILNELPKNFSVKWTLIGSGTLLNEIKQIAKRSSQNVECVFMGELSNKEITNFYSSTSINLFVSVSRSEGIPFSMIEAISFGIPLLSTDVGGCAEICVEQTGILIDKEFKTREAANKILEFSQSQKNTLAFRSGVKEYWDDNFNAAKNYFTFYDAISKKYRKT